MNTTARKSIPFDADDAETVRSLEQEGSPERVALHAVTGITLGTKPSEAERLHAILIAGRKAIEAKALEIGYARAAEFDRTNPERQQWINAVRNHRRLRPFMNDGEQAGAA